MDILANFSQYPGQPKRLAFYLGLDIDAYVPIEHGQINTIPDDFYEILLTLISYREVLDIPGAITEITTEPPDNGGDDGGDAGGQGGVKAKTTTTAAKTATATKANVDTTDTPTTTEERRRSRASKK